LLLNSSISGKPARAAAARWNWGAGRLTIPIAQEGIDIVGADLSPFMLRSARAKGAAAGLQIPFVQADMRQFDLGDRFSAILPPPGPRREVGLRRL
jgi:SAM-dependent methyltransferase